MTTLPVYEVLAEAFVREGVNTCFALLGDANMNWAAAMDARGCEFVYVRDEHCAVAAAMAYSRLSQRVGVATVTCGPGVTQILTALPAAVRAKIPLIVFAGEAPLKSNWYNQAIDQRPFIEACGARYLSLHTVTTMHKDVNDAFAQAYKDQIPIVIGVPFDLQNQPWEADLDFPLPANETYDHQPSLSPANNEVNHATSIIESANKIVVMAGRGALVSGAQDACINLADKLNALLASTLPTRGLFKDHPFNIGIAGGFSTETARRCLMQADLVIAVGTRLAHHNSDGGKLFQADKVLHVDREPRTISQGRPSAAHTLRCDALPGVLALINAIDDKNVSNISWRTTELANDIQTTPACSATFPADAPFLDPRDVVSKLDALLPLSWTTVNSSGHCSYFFAQMPRRPVEHFLTIREFGAIGNGIAFAIGCALARPDEPVVLFDGDGSLMMHIQELETIARHNLNILICIMNDGAYGSEIHKLRAEGLSDAGAVFGRSDFSRIANGFGLTGSVIHNLDDLDKAIEQFTQSEGSAILDFHVSDKVVSPVVRRSHS